MFWIFWKHFVMGNNPAGAPGASRAEITSYTTSTSYRRTNSLFPSEVTASDIADAFASHGNDVFCVINENFSWEYMSGNWETATGFSVKAHAGTSLMELVHPEDQEALAQYLMRANASALAKRFRMKHADGDWHWCDMKFVSVEKNRALRKASFKCLLRNVNELVSAQNDGEQARLEADIAVRSRSEFLANMNHELRTPLNAILGFAQMMESGIYGDIGHPKYKDYIDNIQSSGTTLLSKINNLVDIANIDSGNMLLNDAEHDLSKLIRQAIELHAHRAFAEHIILRDNLPAQPVYALVDEVRFLQVLNNVISNAIKYNRAEGIVDVYCENRRDGGISVVVEDNGNGIPPNHLQRILNAFGQDNSFFARSRNCVGLGLALSKEIVKLHQGRIEIESAEGRGTILKIMLPPERTVVKKRAAKVAKPKKLEESRADLVD